MVWLITEQSLLDWRGFLKELAHPTSLFSAYVIESLFSGELQELIHQNQDTSLVRQGVVDALNRGMVNHVFYHPNRIFDLKMLNAQTKQFVISSDKLKDWALVKANYLVLTSQFSDFFESKYSKFEAMKDRLGSLIKRVDRRWKIETSGFRMAPSFLIAGVQRCGTSSLFHYLCQHPDMAAPERKELHFFNRADYSGDMRHYKSFFPARHFTHKRMITGEATPEYSFYPDLMCRIQAVLPEIKIILIVRDPVQRAISHYRAQAPHRRPKSFRAAMQLDQEFFGDHGLSNSAGLNHYARGQNYISRGRYIDYMPFIYKSFPKENILLMKAEDMFDNPLLYVNDCLEFLGLDKLQSLRSENHTDTNRKGNGLLRSLASLPEPIGNDLEEELYQYFYPYNQMFYEFVRRDMKWDR